MTSGNVTGAIRLGSDLPVITDFDELVRLVEDHDLVYLRYSTGPQADIEGGPSLDYESGSELPGLSATVLTPEPWWNRPTSDWIARRVCAYAQLGEEDGRAPWVLRGRVVGRGPDHEPLLDEIEPLAWLDAAVVSHAYRLYHERLDAGQDSTGQ